jgi:hypothetical protein
VGFVYVFWRRRRGLVLVLKVLKCVKRSNVSGKTRLELSLGTFARFTL